MGARPFVPPVVVVRWVEPSPIDPVVVARGGLARVKRMQQETVAIAAALGAEVDPVRGARFPDLVAEGRALLEASRQRAALRLAAAQTSLTRSRAKLAAARANPTPVPA